MRLSGRLVLGAAALALTPMFLGACASIKDHRGYYADATLIA